ncbi:glycine cleavage system T protein [Trametes versicolor FP-101664 SS1]|uniref:glycine cleavage system T protein n=1 Tax=Trametes versicolor (strain FP-101664) TaxID=717944 RepID=UPI00046238BD|nr:glycine cleavage system T protein [Trametes versicolor FP-101664 SS1]EIW59966.1 glycine cleavage system T protein [Trametes versicolor FP-101664 SS1]
MAALVASRTALLRPLARHARLGLPARCMSSAPSDLRRTALYDFHVKNGAKMVPFASYAMPLQYGDVGAVASHKHVRESVGLFDVSHMVQSVIRGPTATEFLEWITPSDLQSLPAYSSTLSVLLNENGGIIDDLMITKHAPDAFYVVTNAGRRERDIAWFQTAIKEWNAKHDPVELEILADWGLLALQGPEAANYLQGLTSFDLRELTFGKCAWIPIEGFNLHVARGGYTGEDGFEISISPSETVEVAQLLSKSPVQLTGLGARDSLRLEAGMCLYGHDLDEKTTPVEASLNWVIGKRRRENPTFHGHENVMKQLKEGPPRRRVGMIVEGPPAREGAKILDPESKEQIGVVTSGIPSPTLGKNIAMGYVKNGFHKKGTELAVDVRGKQRKAVLTPMPFVPSHYYRG